MNSVDVAVGSSLLFHLNWVHRCCLVFFFFFSNHEEQLRAVSLEPTFLTDGGALVPYEISESTAACEDENVPCKVSHSFIKKKKILP